MSGRRSHDLVVRSIHPDEFDTWAELGGSDVADAALALAADGASGHDRWLIAVRDDRPVGRVGIIEDGAGCGSTRREHRLFGLWLGDDEPTGRAAVGRALARAILARLPAGLQTVDLRSNPEDHEDIAERRAMLASVGGRLFQEKVGCLWEDPRGELVAPVGLRLVGIEAFGRAGFGELVGRCQEGTLDRNDRAYLRLCGPSAWGDQMLANLGSDADSWLAALDPATGEPVGFVALGSFDEPETATIVHIGVVPEARGRGVVHGLMAAANQAARDRGFTRILSDVDTENRPMRDAMERAGHREGRRPWHVWHDRLSVVVAADGTPVTLRAIDAANRPAVMGLRRRPGQERYLGSMASHFEDAIEDARAEPRMWALHGRDHVVGFVMISDGIPAERLASDDDLVGPYYLWRLLIDADQQGRGFGRAAIDLVRDYLATRPGADVLLTSCAAGDASPQPFYLRYGFVLTGERKWGEDILRLDL